jgi:hypothetical protein
MEMQTYKLEELSKSARERVIDTWRDNNHFPWGGEWKDSLKAFERESPLEVTDWAVGYPRTFVDFDMETRGHWASTKGESDDWATEMTGLRLWKYLRRTYGRLLRKDCPLTGYCGDESLLKPIREAIASHPSALRQTSLQDVMAQCLSAWAYDYEDDIDHWLSDEAIMEDIEANEYRFTEDGELA